MKTYTTDKIRNVVLLGHQSTGKTTLAEALAHISGATTRMGTISEGTTLCDFEPEEVRKGLSISLSLAPIEWKDHKVNILDAPGYADFIAETQAALRVADVAVLVVSAVDGVQVQHEQVWRLAEEAGVARVVFVNKMDRERADFHAVLDQLTDKLGAGFAPLDLPLGEEQDFHGVVDVLTEHAYKYEAGRAPQEEAMSAELSEETKALHTKIVESVAETDDALLEKYLGGEELTEKEVVTGLHQGVVEGKVFPVLAGSATKLIGVDRLADLIVEMGPSPNEMSQAVSTDGPFSAFVFKTISDPFVGRLSLFKVMTGKLRPDSPVHNSSSRYDERVAHIFTMRGKQQESLNEVPAGDIAAVAKLAHTRSGETLTEKGNPIAYDPLPEVDRSLAKAIAPKTKGDEEKLMTGLAKLQEEDPALLLERNAETHQSVLWGTGETHLEVALERLARKFSVEVEEIPLRIPYRETITAPGKGLGRHVKQSGGHGQYAICNLEVEPTERGAQFEFVNKVFGGSIPSNFIPSVQKGVEKALTEGVVAGYPVVDIKVTVTDGKYHTVDSSDMAFQIAGAIGFKDAVNNAGVTLLEPVMDLAVLVPEEFLGDVMGDLNAKRGKIQGTEAIGRRQLVKAKVPMAEVARYAIDLRSMTSGQGTFSSTFSHYDPLPAHLTERVVAESKQI